MLKRYKLLIGFIISGIILIIIFFITQDKKVYYLSLGDSLARGRLKDSSYSISYGDYVKDYLEDRKKLEFYTKSFSKNEYRSTDLLNDIKENKKINGLSIKTALVKADIITLSIGMNDLFYKINYLNELEDNYDTYKYIDECLYDVNRLLYEIRSLSKEEVIVLGFFNPTSNVVIDSMIDYANKNLKKLTQKYNMTFLDIQSILKVKPMFLNKSPYLNPTKEGYKEISRKIIDIINNKVLANY